jgi:chaperonin GroEL
MAKAVPPDSKLGDLSSGALGWLGRPRSIADHQENVFLRSVPIEKPKLRRLSRSEFIKVILALERPQATHDADALVGDGVLANEVWSDARTQLQSGIALGDLCRGMEEAVAVIVAKLKEMSIECRTTKQISQVATGAANGDSVVGEIVAEAIQQVGRDGVIVVGEGKGTVTTLRLTNGIRFENGFLSPHFVTDPAEMKTILEDCYILLYENKISSLRDMLPLLEQVARSGRALLVVAGDVDGEALASLVVNKLRGVLRVCAVKAPGLGDCRRASLEDMAVLTGGTLLSEDCGRTLASIEMSQLGHCLRVEVTNDTCTVVEAAGKVDEIETRIAEIQRQIASTDSASDRDKLQDRLSRITGGVAIISVGATTESEMKERKTQVENAVCASRAAVAEGIVPGGGLALLRAASVASTTNLSPAETQGFQVVLRACRAPLERIMDNASLDSDEICDQVSQLTGNLGFNVISGQIEDLVEAGVVEATQVTCKALENALTVATLLLGTDCLVSPFESRPILVADNVLEGAPSGGDSEPWATSPSVSPLAQTSPKSSATLDPSNLTAVKPITTPLGQIIEVLPHAAICWLEVAPGRRVKTEVPLEKLAGIPLFPEMEFCIEVDSTNREVRYSPLQRDMSLDNEFERMCREFEEWRAHVQTHDSKQE